MDKHKRKQKGITLISLVISVIVMLILAGVALNAAIGDNGIISQAQYATFLNEMAAVEEAVALWKINQKESAIPANGLCQEQTLSVVSNKNAERLNGEVGYYRLWSMSQTMPDTSIFASADDFNGEFGAEVVYYPAGAQDLYYLDNEGLGIDSKKEYIIDAVNSMVYSTTGITIKGVRVYSVAMAKAVMSGTIEAPLFAEAEVSGTGSKENLAGNVQDEYLPDGTKNPDYNPYGFKFISSRTSNNVYKLYNNGELYAKGVKGIATGTTAEEINSLSANNWVKWEVPSSMQNSKRILYGNRTIFFIDNSNHLWAYGDNSSNKLGLDEEQKKEYTTREPIKLNITDSNGNLVEIKDVYSYFHCTFVVTKNNEVYTAGSNTSGSQGVGHSSKLESFEKVIGLPTNNIKTIVVNHSWDVSKLTYILFEDGNVYASNSEYVFEKIIDADYISETYNSSIKQICYGSNITTGTGIYLLFNDGYLYKYYNGAYTKIEGVSDIVELPQSSMHVGAAMVAKDSMGDFYLIGTSKETVEKYMRLEWSDFCDSDGNAKKVVELSTVLPEKMIKNDKVKEMLSIDGKSTSGGFIYIMESGDVWSSNILASLGVGDEYIANATTSFTENIELIVDSDGNEGISTLNNVKIVGYESEQIEYCSIYINNMSLVDSNGNLYITNDATIMYGNDILQNSWKKIASGVENAWTFENQLGYIDNAGNAYVLSNDYRNIGEESLVDVEGSNFKKIENVTNVKEIIFSVGATFLLTNDNKLYSAGRNNYDATFISNPYHGFGEDAITKQSLLLENTTYAVGSGLAWSAEEYFVSDNKLYFLGYGQNTPFSSLGASAYRNVTEIDTSIYDLDTSKIKKIIGVWEGTAIITTDGDLYMGGSIYNKQLIGFAGRYLTKVNLNELGIDGKVIDIVNNGGYSNFMILTDTGKLYGTGTKSGLGIDVNLDEYQTTPVKVLEDVSSVHELRGAYIAIKNDGTVWGTGTNHYGVLGRWIGIDRNSPNSRYKTALTWVECPELEI